MHMPQKHKKHRSSGHLTTEPTKPEEQACQGAHYRKHRNVQLTVQFLSVRGLKEGLLVFSRPFNKKSTFIHKASINLKLWFFFFHKGNIWREPHRWGLQRQVLLQFNIHYKRSYSHKVYVKLPSQSLKAIGSFKFLKSVSISNVLSLSPFTIYPSLGFDMVAVTQW